MTKITIPSTYRYTAWEDLINAHEGYWFEEDTFRFFSSRLSWDSLTPAGNNTYLFISSESNFDRTKRFYSIRSITTSGEVSTEGEFQQFDTLDKAKRALAKQLPHARVGSGVLS
jgi:hypothetical protein